MIDSRQERHSAAQSCSCGSSRGWLRRFHKNERGTTMTEFLITLPIFILIFIGMVRLGQFQLESSKIWAIAYQDTWSKALPISEQQTVPVDSSQLHANPARAGSAAKSQLAEHSVYNEMDALNSNVNKFERSTYSGLESGGHWGESYHRVQPASEYVKLRRVDAHVTANPGQIVGTSTYARAIVSDGGAAGAAGIRYGTVFGLGEINPTIMGINIPMYVHFNTLVAPMPYNDAGTTTGAVQQTLLKQPHYKNLLGISMSQPLSGGGSSGSAPDLSWDL